MRMAEDRGQKKEDRRLMTDNLFFSESGTPVFGFGHHFAEHSANFLALF